MEWFYQYGLKVLGLVDPTVVNETLKTIDEESIVTNEVAMDTASDISDQKQINRLLDIRTNPNIPMALYLKTYSPIGHVIPSAYVVNEQEHQLIDGWIKDWKLKQINTEHYSLVINPFREEQYYRDTETQRWAVGRTMARLQRDNFKAPVQVGNAIYLFDVDGFPHFTLDGKLWTKCRRVTATRLEWLLGNADLMKLYEEVVPGGKNQTKHYARTGKKRGTRSRYS